ncbi:MAG: RidA family protein [Gammaproteobacteria bacterium]|jgi:enamine deaminase RidA (YjgF/YER057c/UK114 family)|nr:RidA family protein [Gammaproteobacteria bacterium]
MSNIQRFMVPGQGTPVSHYCHVTRAGDHIWISGTVGVDGDGNVPEDTAEQFRLAIANLDACLRHAGGRPEHIVKVTVYLTNVRDRARINPIREEYFGEHRPASTLVEVSALVGPRLKVEIEAEAVVG